MALSADLCRAQEVLHLARAADAPLANVRTVSERAAAVWGVEALAAEAREGRGEIRSMRATELKNARQFRGGGEADQLFRPGR